MMQNNLILKVSNGRQLGYAEYGDSAGHPVFFFHGFPGSRLQAGDFNDVARNKNCRLIGIDRPGMGCSSPNKSHSLLSWTDDIRALAEHLNIHKFSIIAHSGGAPFALACAYKIPEYIANIALVSAMPPTIMPKVKAAMPFGLRLINGLARSIPGVSWLLMQLQQKVLLKPKIFHKMMQQCPAPDRLICENEEQMDRAILALKEAFKQNVRGAAEEFRLLLKDWGFDLKSIDKPVAIWQGALDKQVLVSYAKLYQSLLPHSTLRISEDDAHLSMLYSHIDEILDSLKVISEK